MRVTGIIMIKILQIHVLYVMTGQPVGDLLRVLLLQIVQLSGTSILKMTCSRIDKVQMCLTTKLLFCNSGFEPREL